MVKDRMVRLSEIAKTRKALYEALSIMKNTTGLDREINLVQKAYDGLLDYQ